MTHKDDKFYFRFHRGGLAESLATEIHGTAEEIILRIKKEYRTFANYLNCKFYSHDNRVDRYKETYIVTEDASCWDDSCDEPVIGFASGDFLHCKPHLYDVVQPSMSWYDSYLEIEDNGFCDEQGEFFTIGKRKEATETPKIYGVVDQIGYSVNWILQEKGYEDVQMYDAWFNKTDLVSLGSLAHVKETDIELYNKLKTRL